MKKILYILMKQELIVICTVNMLIQKEENLNVQILLLQIRKTNNCTNEVYGTTMTGEFFEGWFEGILLPGLPKDAVIVMDNASFHRKKQLYEIAGNNNITLIFLPPYSLKLNPIEKVWANMKKFLLLMTLFIPFFRLNDYTTEVLVTNIFEEFSISNFKELYNMRLGIEKTYNCIKNRFGLESFSGTKPVCILQDFYANLYLYNALAMLMYENNNKTPEKKI